MAEIKDKVVTVESLSALHEHNKNSYMSAVNPTGSGTMTLSGNASFSEGATIGSLVIGADIASLESLSSDESFLINQNNTLKQVNKDDIIFDIVNGGTGATDAATARDNLGAASAETVNEVGTQLGDLKTDFDEYVSATNETITQMANAITPIDKGGTGADNAVTALENLGGTPIVNARTADFDMDVEIAQGRHFKIYLTDVDTLGTPYAYGLSTYKSSAIISYGTSSTYGFQLAIINGGNRMFQRRISNGTLYEWQSIHTNILTSTEYGSSLPDAGAKGRIFFKKA